MSLFWFWLSPWVVRVTGRSGRGGSPFVPHRSLLTIFRTNKKFDSIYYANLCWIISIHSWHYFLNKSNKDVIISILNQYSNKRNANFIFDDKLTPDKHKTDGKQTRQWVDNPPKPRWKVPICKPGSQAYNRVYTCIFIEDIHIIWINWLINW